MRTPEEIAREIIELCDSVGVGPECLTLYRCNLKTAITKAIAAERNMILCPHCNYANERTRIACIECDTVLPHVATCKDMSTHVKSNDASQSESLVSKTELDGATPSCVAIVEPTDQNEPPGSINDKKLNWPSEDELHAERKRWHRLMGKAAGIDDQIIENQIEYIGLTVWTYVYHWLRSYMEVKSRRNLTASDTK